MNKKIFLWNLRRQKGTIVKIRIGLSDFKQIRQIAKQTKSKIKIEQKRGLPFLINRYKKRKFFAITFLVIAILIFLLTRYIWNIEINGLVNITKEEILLELKNNGIDIGKKISNVDTESIINQIRVNRKDIAWIGIDLKGTNVIIEIVEADKKPEIIDENKICNIIAKKDGIIDEIIAQNGTSLVKKGDVVREGDILIAGYMEGKYTERRNVHSLGEVKAKVWYSDKEIIYYNEEKIIDTGEVENKIKIKFKNFQINFYKTLSKFEIYDTMYTEKNIKIFSNFYLPISVIKITNKEKVKEVKNYTVEEAKKIAIENIAKRVEEKIENKDNIIRKKYKLNRRKRSHKSRSDI